MTLSATLADRLVDLVEQALDLGPPLRIGIGRVEEALVRVRGIGVATEQLQRRADVEQDLRARKPLERGLEHGERAEVVLGLEQLHAGLHQRLRVDFVVARLRDRDGRPGEQGHRDERAHHHWTDFSIGRSLSSGLSGFCVGFTSGLVGFLVGLVAGLVTFVAIGTAASIVAGAGAGVGATTAGGGAGVGAGIEGVTGGACGRALGVGVLVVDGVVGVAPPETPNATATIAAMPTRPIATPSPTRDFGTRTTDWLAAPLSVVGWLAAAIEIGGGGVGGDGVYEPCDGVYDAGVCDGVYDCAGISWSDASASTAGSTPRSTRARGRAVARCCELACGLRALRGILREQRHDQRFGVGRDPGVIRRRRLGLHVEMHADHLAGALRRERRPPVSSW